MSEKAVLEKTYRASATATGGRRGHVKTSDGRIDLTLDKPVIMEGLGQGPNPEQFYALALGASFSDALSIIAEKEKVNANAEVTVNVDCFFSEEGDYDLSVILNVEDDGLDGRTLVEMCKKAIQVCPYVKVIEGKMPLKIKANEVLVV